MKSKKILLVTLVVVMISVILTACMPSNYEKAESNLKDNDYTVLPINGSIAKIPFLTVDGINDLEKLITGFNSDGDYVALYYFKNAKSAKSAYEDIIEHEKDEADDDDDIKFGRSGKCIYFGTKAGIKAAK